MPILLTRSRYLRKQLEQSKARVVQLEGALTAAGVPIPDPPAQGGGVAVRTKFVRRACGCCGGTGNFLTVWRLRSPRK
jgi:hypothetical protein